jgi:SAM-dependent methyltransferase
MSLIDSRYEREREFHNAHSDQRWTAVSRFYETAAGSLDQYRHLLASRCRGLTVLEYGCGEGESAIELADHGAIVRGIDISNRRVERARELAAGRKNVAFDVMTAEELSFEDDSFDVICGMSVLHHLNLERALAEVARTLKPGGEAIFLEPLGHNPLINLYRRLTPRFRTPYEHPLVMRDLELARRHFGSVDAEFFHLTSLFAVPFRRFAFFPHVLSALDRLDRGLFTVAPYSRKYGWIAIISLREPGNPVGRNRGEAAAGASAGMAAGNAAG